MRVQPTLYPLEAPPLLSLEMFENIENLKEETRAKIMAGLMEEVCVSSHEPQCLLIAGCVCVQVKENEGESMVYQLVEWVRENFEDLVPEKGAVSEGMCYACLARLMRFERDVSDALLCYYN